MGKREGSICSTFSDILVQMEISAFNVSHTFIGTGEAVIGPLVGTLFNMKPNQFYGKRIIL